MIDVWWIARKGTCARCRWDEMFIEDLLEGTVKRPYGVQPVRHHLDEVPTKYQQFGVVCFPAGAHSAEDKDWLDMILAKFKECILVVTSDEASTFDPKWLKRRPKVHLWVQTPRPEISYPLGTIFPGFGPGGRAEVKVVEKDLQWFFAGQDTHPLRHRLVSDLQELPGGELLATEAFLTGMDREEYLERLSRARVAPCPSGPDTQDSFRLYEAMERGCAPIVNRRRPDHGGDDFWMMLGNPPVTQIDDYENWDDWVRAVDGALPNPAIDAHAWWHGRRRDLVREIHRYTPDDGFGPDTPEFTAVIPTSPIPSHPDISVIEETVKSVRDRTPAEILIMVDGVRWQQRERWNDYREYTRRLLLAAEEWWNVTPIVFPEHLHQAEMLRRTLRWVDSPFILYVEHDTPLMGDIPFEDIGYEMNRMSLNYMRFSHEAHILPDHYHLTHHDDVRGSDETGVTWVPSLQWSQRPHLARTSFYRGLLDRCFDERARTMIEDVVHGVTENDALKNWGEGWENWRMAVYHPEGNIQRSTHTDGRAGDPKFDMVFAYPDDRYPDGAPWPTVKR